MSESILQLNKITKIFPGVKALDKVDFNLKLGEIHALMGENGAGKSTFIKVITGVHQPDEGEILYKDELIEINNPIEAQDYGVAAIYQHVTSYPHLTVTENIFMGHEEKKRGFLDWKEMNKKAGELLKQLQASFKSTDLMNTLSVAQQQLVEIAKALSMDADIIIMDEPTAALTKSESEELYKITEDLRDEGKSIILISHRLEDMYRLADRVTVLRDAQYVGTYDVKDLDPNDLITAMVGREITDLFPKPVIEPGHEVLRVENLSRQGFFEDVSFNVRSGEIIGLTGLVGAGRTEVIESIFGITDHYKGEIFFEGEKISIKNPSDALAYGMGHLTEDRQLTGLIVDWSISRNITLAEIDKFSKNGFIDIKAENKKTKNLAEKVDVKAISIFDKVSSLSGGNQQKVAVAKALCSDLKLLVMDEPTKGVDIGAKAAIYEIMGELAKQGLAIIMISSEMPEALAMTDRIYVMCEGRVTGELLTEQATQEDILKLSMLKHSQEEVV